MADHGFQIPNTLETRFPIASLTKAFTAAAIMILSEAGKLDLEDNAGDFLPEGLVFKKPVPIHQVLSHSAGLPDYQLKNGEILHEVFARRMGSDEFCHRFLKHPLVAPSGEKFHYSNPGYYLLGMIIEAVAEMPFGEFLRRNIFDRAGMEDTGVDDPEKIILRRAQGYRWRGNELGRAAFTDARNFYPQGGLYSTTTDLLCWMNALKSGKILSRDSFQKMMSQQIVVNAEKEIFYGYGMHALQRNGRKAIGHGGSHWGYRSHWEWYPEEDLLAVMLSNYEFQDTAKIADHAIKAALGLTFQDPKKPTRAKISQDALKKYDGKYQSGNFVLKVKIGIEESWLDIEGEENEIYPIGDGLFAHQYLDEQYQILTDEKGGMSLWGCKKVDE
jgi:CubicO group peptidase (beta-lactamase class C family)